MKVNKLDLIKFLSGVLLGEILILSIIVLITVTA